MKSITLIKNYLNEFVQPSDTKDKMVRLFAFSDDRKRAGFEKWLQFELVLFFLNLKDHGRIEDIKIEKKVGAYKSTDKSHFQTDIVITLKSGDSLGLELKVRRREHYAIKALHSDLTKHENTLIKKKATSNFSIVLCGQNVERDRKKSLTKEFHNFEVIPVDVVNSVCFLVAEEE